MSINIKLAENCGFCFGVRRAVDTVYELRKKTNKKICIVGELIHNNVFIKRMEDDGIYCISEEDAVKIENPSETVLVIRTHGVTKQTEENLRATGCEIVDATCPFVKRIHRIVDENSKDSEFTVIVGDRNHPEVIGIKSYANGDSEICSDDAECSNVVNKLQQEKVEKVLLVSQTTGNNEKYVNCQKNVKKVYTKAKIFDTICSVTENRQNEVKELAMNANLMCVIGCTKSSNTRKLYDIASTYCRNVYLLETADELNEQNLKELYDEWEKGSDSTHDFTVGITAGASTPDDIIEEVKVRIEKILF